MKVIKSEEDLLEFDNGLKVIGVGDVDCCAHNYMDFEQIPVGTEFKTMDLNEFKEAMRLEEDGFAINAKDGTPKWAQARSVQNGYYSAMTSLFLEQNGVEVNLGELHGEESD